MRQRHFFAPAFGMGFMALWLTALSGPAWAGPSKDETVDKFLHDCAAKPVKDATCEKLRNEFVEILKEDLRRLGSTTRRTYLPVIVRMLESHEVELRIAAADAIGMIGPQDSDVDKLAPFTNDPVPDVRHAVSSMLNQGKGSALALLKQRAMPMRTGRTPEKPSDAEKFSMPVAPDSVYLFDTSDATRGRLSYVVRKGDAAAFFKGKAKKGPYKWDQFKELYRYQLKDEEEAMDEVQREAGKQLQSEKAPDPTNMEAYMAYLQKMQSVSMQGSMGRIYFDSYQPNLYGTPTVYVLEERQIGQRSYPTRYIVAYQELAYKRQGYRLVWTTVPDSAIKAVQATSLAQEQEELANKAEREALKKKAAELEALTRKKDAAEKKQFKKGQEDLEKALGF